MRAAWIGAIFMILTAGDTGAAVTWHERTSDGLASEQISMSSDRFVVGAPSAAPRRLATQAAYDVTRQQASADTPHRPDELPVWRRHHVQVLAAIVLILAQAMLIQWLLAERRRRLRLETAARDLTGKLIAAQEGERGRLARELHDDVIQRLALLAVQAGREESRATDLDTRVAMRDIRQSLAQLSGDVHALSYNLHPSMLEDLGLRDALRSECENLAQTCSFRLNFNAEETSERLPPDVGLCLFRIAQESLRNVARHAAAERVTVLLRPSKGGVLLTVEDDGVGFDAKRTQHDGAHLGHASMRQRVALLGGRLAIESTRGAGTLVHAWLPLLKT